MRSLLGFLTIMGAIAVVVILALATGYVLSILTPDLRDAMRPVVLSSEAADSLTNKFSDLQNQIDEARSQKTTKDVRLVVTEEELNSSLVMMLAEGSFPAQEILVNFNEDIVVVYVGWRFPGFPAKTLLVGQVEINDGTPKVIVNSVHLGKIAIPGNFNENIQNLINAIIKLNTGQEETRLNLQQVSIGDGQLVITGTAGKSD